MSELQNRIVIRGEYTRAANVERGDSGEYILTDIALSTLRSVAKNLDLASAPRAWHLIGPYGAGKSAFALYLAALLGPHGKGETNQADAVCAKRDKKLAQQFAKVRGGGFCPVFLTGTRDLLPARLVHALIKSLKAHYPKAKSPSKKSEYTVPETVQAFRLASQAVVKEGGAGIFIVIDEMGKFLERDAIDSKSDNAMLLQHLAESKNLQQKGDGSIFLLGIMHHSGDYYFRDQGQDAINEWRKVAGRFEEKPFIESPEHMLRLLASMFEFNLSNSEQKRASKAAAPAIRALARANVFADQKISRKMQGILSDCHPLHPVTAVLLTLLSEKMGQNERTLFAYIGGAEQHGFADSVSMLQSASDMIELWTLYDYFFASGSISVTDPLLRRTLAESKSALLRLGEGAPKMQVQMLKTVALFNLAGARNKFTASKAMLEAVFGRGGEAKKSLAALQKKSLVIYRKFSDDYRLWQGSDFDLDEAINNEMDGMGQFHLADALNKAGVLPPIVARRHAIKTGNLRRLRPYFVDSQNWKDVPEKTSEPRLVIFLKKTVRDEAIWRKVRERFSDDMVAQALGGKLAGAVRANTALHLVLNKRREDLHADPVAAREIKEEAARAAMQQDKRVNALASEIKFVYLGKDRISITGRRGMQQAASKAMDRWYRSSPHVVNELINREKPSGQALGGRNKLLLALHGNEHVESLGIEKYPPEKGLYMSMLKKARIHYKPKQKGGWQLFAPNPRRDPCNYGPAWQKMDSLLKGGDERAFTDLNEILSAPPFGMKAGLLPLFYGLFILANKDLAVYEDGQYQPFFDAPRLERFLARPETFKFRRFAMGANQRRMLKIYRDVLGENGKGKPGDIIPIARMLVRFFNNLPEYTRNTGTISENSRKFLGAISNAKSPYDMLLHDIPHALGAYSQKTTMENMIQCADRMKKVINELESAHRKMLDRLEKILAKGLGVNSRAKKKLRTMLAKRAEGLKKYSTDEDGLLGFFQAVTDKTLDHEAWFGRLLLLSVGKNPEKWKDSDFNCAKLKIAEYLDYMANMERLIAWENESPGDRAPLARVISSLGDTDKYQGSDAKKWLKKAEKARKNIFFRSSKFRIKLLIFMLKLEIDENSDVKENSQNPPPPPELRGRSAMSSACPAERTVLRWRSIWHGVGTCLTWSTISPILARSWMKFTSFWTSLNPT